MENIGLCDRQPGLSRVGSFLLQPLPLPKRPVTEQPGNELAIMALMMLGLANPVPRG